MALAPGTRLGPYEIAAQIGVGGMGEVYQATDTNLKRQVAIKVLPESVALDAERLARFQREAEVLAALNHPNIAGIYGLERSDGTMALVMELVEGPTLAEVIAGGASGIGLGAIGQPQRDRATGPEPQAQGPKPSVGLPVQEALPIARQIAEALEAAHEAGIIHRDLKPANIKIQGAWGPRPRAPGPVEARQSAVGATAATPTRGKTATSSVDSRPRVTDGTVKVLDFGLAKAMDTDSGSVRPDLTTSPTITTPAMTQAGMILGTAAYMSPEQARGGAADRRADVWAFGCVLFEMLTGRPAFEGKTVSDVLAGVLRADPEWQSLPAELHPRLRLMLERCLARDVRDRYQGIADARVDVEAALSDPTGADWDRSTLVDGPVESATRRWVTPVVTAAAGALLAVLATLAVLGAPDAGNRTAIRFSMVPPDGLVFGGSIEAVPFAVSPDGLAIVFAAFTPGSTQQLWVQSLDADGAQPLQGTENATGPFWSPDSEWIGFYTDGNLKRVRRTGGEPQTVTATRANGAGGSAWSTNDTILFKSGRFEAPWLGVSAQGGPVTEITRLAEGENTQYWPAFLPDGTHFLHRVNGSDERRGLYLASLDGAEPRLLMADPDDRMRGLAYVPGFVLFSRDGALVARRFDDERLEILEDEFRLVDDVPSGAGSWDPWSVSAGGVLAFLSGSAGLDSVLRWYGRDGSALEAIGARGRYAGFALSPDGRRMAFSRYVGGTRDVWVHDIPRGSDTRLTFDGDSFTPIWSPDGAEVGFSSSMDHTVPDLYVTGAGGGGDAPRRVIEPTAAVEVPGGWSRGGDIVYASFNPDGQSDLWRVQLPDGVEERLPLSGAFNENQPRLSPNGEWIAYVTDESGRREVWVARYPSGDGRTPVSNNGGTMPEWRADGAELYYVSHQRELMAVSIQGDASDIDVGLPAPLFPMRDLLPFAGTFDGLYVPSNDGQRFLASVLAPDTRQTLLRVIVNWPALMEE